MKIGIIGGGPVGLTLSLLLNKINKQAGQQLINCITFEKTVKVYPHPKAHVINSRGMEIMRHVEIADQIYANIEPQKTWEVFQYSSYLDKEPLKRMELIPEHYQKLYDLSGYEKVVHYPQNQLEPLLREKALQEHCEIIYGQEIEDITENPDSAFLIKDKNGKKYEFDYIVACDGAGSKIRQKFNIPMKGELLLHFSSLFDLLKDQQSMLYFIWNPYAQSTLVKYSNKLQEFVMHIPFYSQVQNREQLDNAYFLNEINKVLQKTKLNDVNIQSVQFWNMSALNSIRYRNNNLFLAGDAAHRFPPAGGFGLNTGLEDAISLAWRFGQIAQQAKNKEILNSYCNERRLSVERTLRRAVENYNKTLQAAEAIGFNINTAFMLESLYPKVLGPSLFKNLMSFGGNLLYREKQGQSYLQKNTHNLLQLLFPEEDIYKILYSGFFEENGGGFAPKVPDLNTKQFRLDKFTLLCNEKDKYANFQQQCEFPVDVQQTKQHLERDLLIRPDGVVFKSITK